MRTRHLFVGQFQTLAAGATTLLLGASALAAPVTPPVDAGTLLREQPRPAPAGAATGAASGRIGVPPGEPGSNQRSGGPASPEATVRVKVFQLKGDITVFSRGALSELLSAYLERPLSLAELQQAAQAVTRLYRDQGYFLARAYLPQQDVTEGTVVVVVNEGMLDADHGISVPTEGLRLRSHIALDVMRHVSATGKPLRLEEIERGLLLLNDIPGLTASANLERGSSPGTLRMAVNLQEAAALQGYAMADNHGGRYTGLQRLTLGLLLNGWLGQREQFTLQMTQAPQSAGGRMGFLRLGYSQGIGVSGLRMGLIYSDVRYVVGQEFRSLDYKGSAQELTSNLRYPLIRSRSTNFITHASYSRKALRDEAAHVRISDKRVELLSAGFALDIADGLAGGGSNQINAMVSGGKLDLGRLAASLAADQAAGGGRATQGGFNKLSWNLQRLQRISPQLSLAVQLNGQNANKGLDSSERFQLGGPGGVRGYPAGEASGDNGMRGSLEARYDAGRLADAAEFAFQAFYDWGRIRSRNSAVASSSPAPSNPPASGTLTSPTAYSLQSVGVGLVVYAPQAWELRAQWARQMGGNPTAGLQGRNADGSTKQEQLWLNISMPI